MGARPLTYYKLACYNPNSSIKPPGSFWSSNVTGDEYREMRKYLDN
jgi:hypothetical protein